METNKTTSLCQTSFQHWDIDLSQQGCPVKNCKAKLITVPFRWRGRVYDKQYCREHGLRFHGRAENRTFVYYGGSEEARLRNFIFESSFANEHILNNLHKAETHRLGYELSEDAVTWNVFVALSKAGMLSETMSWLAGRKIDGEPELYLWGCRVDFRAGKFVPYSLLKEGRVVIEPDIKRFPTEPDVMLIVPGKFVMCIEAKFTSGNTLAQKEETAETGEKPKHTRALLDRYLYCNAFWDKRCIIPERIGSRFHSQLFRNVVFAAGIAEKFDGDWQVVNLVRSTGNRRIRLVSNVDFEDPTDAVRCYGGELQRAVHV